jgi:hypothetical protein
VSRHSVRRSRHCLSELRSRKTPAQVVSLRIPRADLALARKPAEEKGVPTYIKSLLHETLAALRNGMRGSLGARSERSSRNFMEGD